MHDSHKLSDVVGSLSLCLQADDRITLLRGDDIIFNFHSALPCSIKVNWLDDDYSKMKLNCYD